MTFAVSLKELERKHRARKRVLDDDLREPDAGACAPPISAVLLDSRQPSPTEVPMRLVGLVIALVLSLRHSSRTTWRENRYD